MSVHNQVGKKGRKKIDKERKKIDVREKENRKRKKERKIDQERKKERKNSLLEKPRLICKEEREREIGDWDRKQILCEKNIQTNS